MERRKNFWDTRSVIKKLFEEKDKLIGLNQREQTLVLGINRIGLKLVLKETFTRTVKQSGNFFITDERDQMCNMILS